MVLLKNKTISLICSLLAIILGLFLGYLFIKNIIKKEYKIDFKIYDTSYERIDLNKENSILLAVNNDKQIVINLDDEIVDENNEEGYIKIFYDEFYTITKDNIITLKRNNTEIVKVNDMENQYLLYTDENTETIRYISPYYNNAITDYSAKYKIAYYSKNDEAFLYDADTGNIIFKEAEEIVPVVMNNSLKFFYIVTQNNTYLFDINTAESIDLGNSKLISDISRNKNENMIFNSSRYLVIDNGINRGLINLKGEIVIPLLYKDIFFKDDREDLIVAQNIAGKYGVISNTNSTKIDFSYDGIIVDSNYIMLLRGNRIGVMDRNLQIIHNFLVPYNSSPFIPRETYNNKNTFTYGFKSGNLVIYSEILKDFNTYIISPYGLVNLILGEKPYIVSSNLNNAYYIVTEKYENNYLFLKIYDAAGTLISTYTKNNSKNISSITVNLVSKEIIKINYYDAKNNYITSEVIDAKTGGLITEDKSNSYGPITNITTAYYEKQNNELLIYNKEQILLDRFEGEEIKYLNGNKYLIKQQGAWHLLQMEI